MLTLDEAGQLDAGPPSREGHHPRPGPGASCSAPRTSLAPAGRAAPGSALLGQGWRRQLPLLGDVGGDGRRDLLPRLDSQSARRSRSCASSRRRVCSVARFPLERRRPPPPRARAAPRAPSGRGVLLLGPREAPHQRHATSCSRRRTLGGGRAARPSSASSSSMARWSLSRDSGRLGLGHRSILAARPTAASPRRSAGMSMSDRAVSVIRTGRPCPPARDGLATSARAPSASPGS